MKVALLLHGQPRCALDTVNYIKNNLIVPNKADVFIHMWFDQDDLYMEKGEMDRGRCFLEKDLDKKLIDLYQPKDYLIEKQRFKDFDNFGCNYYQFPDKYIENYQNNKGNGQLSKDEVKLRVLRYTHLSQLYSIFKCNLLKEDYSYKNNILYDYVIKIRFDAIPKIPISCKLLDNRYLYYQDLNQPDDIISDWFNIGSTEIMNIYCSMFMMFKYLNNTKGYYKQSDRETTSLWDSRDATVSVEYLTRDLMRLHKIPYKKMAFGIFLHKDT